MLPLIGSKSCTKLSAILTLMRGDGALSGVSDPLKGRPHEVGHTVELEIKHFEGCRGSRCGITTPHKLQGRGSVGKSVLDGLGRLRS